MAVIGLPVNLGAVADAADRRGSGGRFALNAVYVEVTPAAPAELEYAADGHGPPAEVKAASPAKYRVSATDTKRLVMVEGEAGDVSEVPGLAAVHAAANSGTKGLVPLPVFKKVFADAAKATKSRNLCRRPELRNVLTSLAPHEATLGYTDLETEQVQRTPLVEGKFPPAADIVKRTREKPPAAKFSADPKMLAEVLKTLASFCDDEGMRVDVEVRGENKPLILTCRNPQTGQDVTAVVMPLSD